MTGASLRLKTIEKGRDFGLRMQISGLYDHLIVKSSGTRRRDVVRVSRYGAQMHVDAARYCVREPVKHVDLLHMKGQDVAKSMSEQHFL